MKSDDHELSGEAVEEKIDALNKNETREITDHPQDHNFVGNK